MYKLRPYQQEAVDIAIAYLKRNSTPALLELATGAGKSLICAEIAKIMHELSGKKVYAYAQQVNLYNRTMTSFY